MIRNHKFHLVFILLTALLLGWQLLRPGFFSMQDDLQVMRLYQMDNCFQNGQIPCRWSSDMGAGYGQPMFNYYSAFPYYLGELFHLFGFAFVDVVKILFILSLVFSGVFSYLFLSTLFSPLAALVGSLAYLIVPFRALEVFVRGALSEAMALSLIPLVLYFVVKSSKRATAARSVGLAISLALLLTTHNITSILFAPVLAIFLVASISGFKSSAKTIWSLLSGLLLGVGLSAFFTLPVALERGLIQSASLTQGYFDFRAHFVAISQLFFSSSWGYGASVPGVGDGLLFSIGLFQTFIFFASPIVFLLGLKNHKQQAWFGLSVWLVTLLYLFLTHNQSIFIWESLPFLAFIQFPWRALGMIAVGTSILAAIFTDFLPKKYQIGFAAFSLLLLFMMNFSYFRFEQYYPNVTDHIKLSGAELVTQQKSAILDYMPVASRVTPQEIAPALPQTTSTRVEIKKFEKRSNYFNSEFDIYEDNVLITFPITYFPGWEIYRNHIATPFEFSFDNDLGLITVRLDKGHHVIQGFFENTPSRMWGNLITFFSATTVLLWLVLDKHEE